MDSNGASLSVGEIVRVLSIPMIPIDGMYGCDTGAFQVSQKIKMPRIIITLCICLCACTNHEHAHNTPRDAELSHLDGPQSQDMDRPSDAGVDSQQRPDSTRARDSMLTRDSTSPVDMNLARDSSVEDMALEVDAVTLEDLGMEPDAGQPDAAPDPETIEQMIERVLTRHGVAQMNTRLPSVEIQMQAAMYGDAVDFETALDRAIVSFLTDGSDLESPLSLVGDVVGGPCPDPPATARIRCYLDHPDTRFELYGDAGFAPENGESIQGNWIFILMAERLSDHIQWAIVDRTGAVDTYNYGFN